MSEQMNELRLNKIQHDEIISLSCIVFELTDSIKQRGFIELIQLKYKTL